jgi:hypothetical protein
MNLINPLISFLLAWQAVSSLADSLLSAGKTVFLTPVHYFFPAIATPKRW